MQHPDIVSVHDSDRDVDVACLVMEFVQGEDLKHHLDAGHTYTPPQTLRIMADLLSALGYAHQQNVVHQDIKLANFGVARTQDPGDATRTRGTIVGTLKYMSPEQLEGKPIDARTDLFAAGVAPCCQPNPCGPLLAVAKASKAANPVVTKPSETSEKQTARQERAALPEAATIVPSSKAASVAVADSPNAACGGRFLLAFKTV